LIAADTGIDDYHKKESTSNLNEPGRQLPSIGCSACCTGYNSTEWKLPSQEFDHDCLLGWQSRDCSPSPYFRSHADACEDLRAGGNDAELMSTARGNCANFGDSGAYIFARHSIARSEQPCRHTLLPISDFTFEQFVSLCSYIHWSWLDHLQQASFDPGVSCRSPSGFSMTNLRLITKLYQPNCGYCYRDSCVWCRRPLPVGSQPHLA